MDTHIYAYVYIYTHIYKYIYGHIEHMHDMCICVYICVYVKSSLAKDAGCGLPSVLHQKLHSIVQLEHCSQSNT